MRKYAQISCKMNGILFIGIYDFLLNSSLVD